MTPEEIMANARKLRDERFALRNAKLQMRSRERYNETVVDVPDAYASVAQQHSSNIINDEVRQVTTISYAWPVPHIPPPFPEDQASTTKCEQFLDAMMNELQDHYGPVWEQCTEAQVDDGIGWIFFAPKRKPYAGQPKPPPDDADFEVMDEYAKKNARYKRDAGIAAVFDYEYAVTSTVLPDGNPFNPHCVYVWKEVLASTFKKSYGEMENITGYPEGSSGKETMVSVVEYWDAEECQIIAETRDTNWTVDSWKHNIGRVPYYARPCFITKELDEEKKYATPVDGIYNEMPSHKRLRTMMDAVAYQTAFSPMKITTKEQGETILDDSGSPQLYIRPRPGEAMQLRPGQDIAPIGQSPEIGVLANETLASQQRIERFTLSPVAKGISPGADTPNAALSNLHRFQLSTLDPLTQMTARQARAMFTFALKWIRQMEEEVAVYDSKSAGYVTLTADDIVSTRVEVKATPDQGQQQLLIEKHAMELWMAGAITENEMHEMRGKENPEDYTAANAAERLKKQLEPVIMQQLITDFGMLDAMKAMDAANAQGQPSSAAVAGLMDQARQMNGASGMGSGSAGQPRTPGTRMPTQDVNTQRSQSGGY